MKLLMTTLVVTTSNVQSEQLSKAAFDKREVFDKEKEHCDGESYGSRLNTNLLKKTHYWVFVTQGHTGSIELFCFNNPLFFCQI